MTSLRTWSSALTSRRLLRFLGPALLGPALLAGCAAHTRPAPPPPIRGYVNLDALTRDHPGRSGVSRYDAALRRLEAAARSLPPADRPDQTIATLPALPPAAGEGGAALPSTAIGQTASRLTAVQRSLLNELRSRRQMARADQIASRQDGWLREAGQQYPVPTERSASSPDLALQLLQANVEALTKTLDGWKQSVPPAPERETLRAKVEADRARLEALIAARVQARDAAQTRREQELRRLRDARVAYVQTQLDALDARLRQDDARFLAGQRARLTQQRLALLGALAQPAPVSVPVAGNIGTQTLPKEPGAGRAALAGKSLAEAEAHLRAQRARWVGHLYDDTRAAAQDTADQQNLDVTFGPPRPGDRDLTPALAQAMKAGVWRL